MKQTVSNATKRAAQYRTAVVEIEPKIDLLHQVTGLDPRIARLCCTSDGFFLAMRPGDIGFNAFLGNPSKIAIARSRALFSKLDKPFQREAIGRILEQGIPLTAVFGPGDLC